MAVAVLVAVTVLPTAAEAQVDALKSAHEFVDAFNKGDTKGAVAACADAVALVDQFAPFVWHGASDCGMWMKDYEADAVRRGIEDGVLTLGAPLHADVDGDHPYLVIPSTYAFKLKGKAVKKTGSLFTFAMRKGPNGWANRRMVVGEEPQPRIVNPQRARIVSSRAHSVADKAERDSIPPTP